MERNRDLRRTAISTANGLPRRRQRITTLRDSTDEDRQMELQETVRLRDREQLQKKDRDREFLKRRRVDRSAVQQRSGAAGSYRENESTDSSDEEYYEEEEETRIQQQNRMNQLSPTSSSMSINRRGLRTLRSTPVFRAAADEMLGVPIPRRARSTSAKRLHEYWNSGSGGFGEDLSHRRFSPSPATVSLIGSGGASPSSSGASLKKKMKYVETRTRVLSSASNSKHSSVIQDDIEIEVAEALFDLMKQSQSQSSQKQEKGDRESTNTSDDELNRLKAEGDKDENNAFKVQNEQSIKVNAEPILADSMKELKKEGRIEKEKFQDDPAQEFVSGDGFVNKGKVGSPKESEPPSCVKVNACDIQDPTVTKADYAAIVVEANKEAKLEIDLMAPPSLPSSPERDGLVDIATDPKVMTQDVQKKSETISKDGSLAVAIRMQEEKIGVISSNQLLNLDLEKHRHDILSVSDSTSQQHQGRKEQKKQLPTSLLPFPIGLSSWPGVLPHPGFIPPLQTVLPMDGSARSSMMMQLPPFKLSQPRPKRCATHQYIAHNIHYHQQLVKKSVSSGPTGPATSYGTKPLNLRSMLPTHKFIPGNPLLGDFQGGQNLANMSGLSGKDKSSDAAAAFNAATSGKSVLQQASHQAPANNFLHGPSFIFPLGHHQTTMMAPANSSGPPQSASAGGSVSLPSNSARRLSVNLPLPGASAAVSFNHPIFPCNEAAPYMAMLQNSGCPIPISTSIAMPAFKGGSPTVPFLNSSFYSPPVFNVAQNQHQLSLPHAPVQSASQNTSTFSGLSSHKQPQGQQQTSIKMSDNEFPTSVTADLPQPEKLLKPLHSSSKSDTEVSRKSGASVADGLVSHSVKPNNARTCSFPVQPMNFAVIPPVSIGGGGGVGNKHGDPPQQGSKGRVELIPQAFPLSFGSNASTTPVLNFSSMAQNSAIFQMLPDMSRNGNQMAQHMNFQASEGKSPICGDNSLNFSKSDCTDISALSMMGTSKSDCLARTINFLPSSLTGNHHFQSSSAALTSGVSVTIPNSHQHQQQLIQLQKQHMHQMQLTGTAQVKPSTPNSIPGSSLTSIFPSNNPVFTQVSVQTDNSSFPPRWENFPRTTAPEGSSQSATSTLLNIPQLKSSQGQNHIIFGNSPASAASFQGHQIVINSQPVSSLIVGSPSNSSISKNMGSNQRTASTVNKAASTISALTSQETEASPNGPSQKSSPACGRNLPSILSTCPSQLSELKY
ncbi:hypothetical protein Pfo_006306 [Paulownia fortunei]|nr:hypothetical protein Pfo_006306 [Paulownia fortunei]